MGGKQLYYSNLSSSLLQTINYLYLSVDQMMWLYRGARYNCPPLQIAPIFRQEAFTATPNAPEMRRGLKLVFYPHCLSVMFPKICIKIMTTTIPTAPPTESIPPFRISRNEKPAKAVDCRGSINISQSIHRSKEDGKAKCAIESHTGHDPTRDNDRRVFDLLGHLRPISTRTLARNGKMRVDTREEKNGH
jgi:hypothetical protein